MSGTGQGNSPAPPHFELDIESSSGSFTEESGSTDDDVDDDDQDDQDQDSLMLAFKGDDLLETQTPGLVVSLPTPNQEQSLSTLSNSVFRVEPEDLGPVLQHELPATANEELQEEIAVHKERSNKHAIHEIVVANLFPRIKFFNKDTDFEFSMKQGSICHYVFNMCNLKYQQNQEALLWEKAKKWIQVSITKLRSSKCTAIRRAFYGKSSAD